MTRSNATTRKSCAPLAPPDGALEWIGQLPVPCHETMDWAKWPKPFLNELTGGVPSLFGRLVLLGTIVDRGRQRYMVPVSGSLCQCAVITDVMRRAHTDYLIAWLQLSLEQKIRDVSLYLDSVGGRAQAVRKAILDCRAEDILPLGAETFSDHLIADTKLSVALLQTLAVPDKRKAEPLLSSPRRWSRLFRIFTRRAPQSLITSEQTEV